MATLSETLTPGNTPEMRPFDARNDLASVADLVELCFAETLDADGREYLHRMRSAAQSPSWLGWAAQVEWAQPAMGGYVWQDGQALIGNVSLIPYFVKGRRFFLIANVAVHPDYRRRGIARQLTVKAIEHARKRGSPSVWLHVREDNQAAVQLYADLGFIERARRTSWISEPEYVTGGLQPDECITMPSARHWGAMRDWLQKDYPPELSWHIPLNLNSLNPGWAGRVVRFLWTIRVRQWALLHDNHLVCSLAWQPTLRNTRWLWLAAPDHCSPRQIQALLTAARQDIPSPSLLSLDYPARRHEAAIRSAGFSASQTLIWMELPS